MERHAIVRRFQFERRNELDMCENMHVLVLDKNLHQLILNISHEMNDLNTSMIWS